MTQFRATFPEAPNIGRFRFLNQNPVDLGSPPDLVATLNQLVTPYGTVVGESPTSFLFDWPEYEAFAASYGGMYGPHRILSDPSDGSINPAEPVGVAVQVTLTDRPDGSGFDITFDRDPDWGTWRIASYFLPFNATAAQVQATIASFLTGASPQPSVFGDMDSGFFVSWPDGDGIRQDGLPTNIAGHFAIERDSLRVLVPIGWEVTAPPEPEPPPAVAIFDRVLSSWSDRDAFVAEIDAACVSAWGER